MIHLEETIVSGLGAEQTFRYVADFSHLPEWDRGIVEARKLTRGPVALGTRFHVVAAFLGRRVPMTYEIADFEAPLRVVLRGEATGLRAVDEIEIEPIAGFGSRLRYRADFDLGVLGRLVAPLLRPAFVAMGKRAIAGLEAELRRAAAASPTAPSAQAASPRHDRTPPQPRRRRRAAPSRASARARRSAP